MDANTRRTPGAANRGGGRGFPADGSLPASFLRCAAVPVQMELMRIIINENSDQHIIFLKEVEGDRMFPIVIGIFEASSIDRRVKNQPTPPPPPPHPRAPPP